MKKYFPYPVKWVQRFLSLVNRVFLRWIFISTLHIYMWEKNIQSKTYSSYLAVYVCKMFAWCTKSVYLGGEWPFPILILKSCRICMRKGVQLGFRPSSLMLLIQVSWETHSASLVSLSTLQMICIAPVWKFVHMYLSADTHPHNMCRALHKLLINSRSNSPINSSCFVLLHPI